MKQRAHFDYQRFAADVKTGLAETGMSYRQFTARAPWVTKSSISRAVNGKPLGVANFLGLCRALRLEPMSYFSVQNQPVSVAVSRETSPRNLREIVAAMKGERV
jgi:hypothetical protein